MEFLANLGSGAWHSKRHQREAYRRYTNYCGCLAIEDMENAKEYSKIWWENLFAGAYYGVPSCKIRLQLELKKLRAKPKHKGLEESVYMAHFYLTGLVKDQDLEKAFAIYEKKSPLFTAMCYFQGIGVAQNRGKAIDILSDSIRSGDEYMNYFIIFFSLFSMNKETWMTEENLAVVVGCFMDHAENGCPFCSFFAGIFLAYGIIVQQNEKKAEEYLVLAQDYGLSIDQAGTELQDLIYFLMDNYGD